MPPDDPLAAQEPILKLDSINYGFAAGCEAGLCPAVGFLWPWGYAPGSAFGLGLSPDQGHSPNEN
jgi:hypothetical protein